MNDIFYIFLGIIFFAFKDRLGIMMQVIAISFIWYGLWRLCELIDKKLSMTTDVRKSACFFIIIGIAFLFLVDTRSFHLKLNEHF